MSAQTIDIRGSEGTLPDEPLRPQGSRLASAALLLVLATFVSVTYWPGHMSGDTIMQISQLHTGRFTDYHSPVLMSLWRLVWFIIPGTWYVLCAAVSLFVLATYVLLGIAFDRRGALLATTAITLSPLVLGYLGVLSRDTWYLALTLSAFAALAKAVAEHGRRQIVLAASALAFSGLAMAARQNGFPVVLVVSFGVLGILRPRFSRGRRHLWLLRLGLALGATAVLAGGQLIYMRVALQVVPAHPEQTVFLYDTIGMSLRDGEMLLPPEVFPAQDLAELRQRTSVASIDGALFNQPVLIPVPVAGNLVDDLREIWFDAIRDHPAVYLDTRWDLWLQQIGWSADVLWIQHPFVDRNPWGYRPTFPELEQRANRYVSSFASSPSLEGGSVHKVWFYLLLDVAGLLYLKHRDRQRQVLGMMCLTALLYEATFFFGAMGNQYRFSLPAVAIALIIGCVGTRDLIRRSEA